MANETRPATGSEAELRNAKDLCGQGLGSADVKAIASGNPGVRIPAEADTELQRLAILRKNRHDEQDLARRNLRDLPDSVRHLARRVEGLTADMATMAEDGPELSTEEIGERMKRMPGR